MRCWFFQIVVMVSSVVLIMSILTWMRSSFSYEGVVVLRGDTLYVVGYGGGDFIFDRYSLTLAKPSDGSIKSKLWSGESELDSLIGDFEWTIVPMWHVAALSSVLPFVWLLSIRKRRQTYRSNNGLCVACGYDLTGSPCECPECGTAAVRSA